MTRPEAVGITAGDSASAAVRKARAAEQALCLEMRDHYQSVTALTEWLGRVGDSDGEIAAAIGCDAGELLGLLRLAFVVGDFSDEISPVELPASVHAAGVSARGMVEQMQQALDVDLPAAVAELSAGGEDLLTKSRAVLAEKHSTTNLRRAFAQMSQFVSALREQTWSRQFFVDRRTPVWSSIKGEMDQ